MSRQRYEIQTEDVSAVHHWLRERFRDREWSFQFPAEAYERFPLERPTAKKLQKWCDRWMVKKHPKEWKRLQNAIRSARRDKRAHVTTKLTRKAHRILSDLSKREKITLSEVVEKYIPADRFA